MKISHSYCLLSTNFPKAKKAPLWGEERSSVQ